MKLWQWIVLLVYAWVLGFITGAIVCSMQVQ
jgi:hypothetical protein